MRKLVFAIAFVFLCAGVSAVFSQSCTWSQTWNFNATSGLQGWTWEGGAYSSGLRSLSAGDYGYVNPLRTVSFSGDSVLTNLSFTRAVGGSWGLQDKYIVVNGTYNGCGYSGILGQGCTAGEPRWNGSLSSGTISFYFAGQPASVYGYIPSITFQGTGTNPFTGQSSCAQPPNADFIATPISGYSPLTVSITNISTGEIIAHAWEFQNHILNCVQTPDSTLASPPPVTYTSPGTYYICLRVTGQGGLTDTHTVTISVLDGAVGAQTFTIPLSAQDWSNSTENTRSGMYSRQSLFDADVGWTGIGGTKSDHAVTAVTQRDKQNADVMAVAGGRVILVEPISVDRCAYWFNGRAGVNCYYDMPQPVSGSALPWSSFVFELTNAYRVVVEYSPNGVIETNTVIEYWVTNPTVQTEDVISEGCTLGKTLAMFPIIDDDVVIGLPDIGVGLEAEAVRFGLTWLMAWDYEAEAELYSIDEYPTLELLPALITQRIPSTRCNESPIYSSCFNDGALAYESEWDKDGLVVWDADGRGVTLSPGASITDQRPLQSGTSYGMDVNVSRDTSDRIGGVAISIGLTTQVYNLKAPTGVYSIAPAVHIPDAGGLYSIRIENVGAVNLHISRACVSPNSGNGTGLPVLGSCSLSNVSFDQGLDGWVGGQLNTTPGTVLLSSGSSLSQAISIPAGQYTLEIKSRAPLTWQGVSGSFAWEYALGGAYATVGSSIPLSQFFASPFNEYRFSQVINVPTPFTGSLAIRPQYTASGQAIVDQVCLRPASLAGDVGGIGELPPFDLACASTNAAPQIGVDIGAWVYWQTLTLQQFFNCDLMIMLNKMFIEIQRAGQFGRWQMLYWQSYGMMFNQWMKDFTGWLGGHLSNIAHGRATTIINGAQQCADLFCVLQQVIRLLETVVTQLLRPVLDLLRPIVDTLLSLVNQAAALLFNIVNVVLSILLLLINQVFGLWNQVTAYVGAFTVAWNDAPVEQIAILPYCATNPRSNVMCMAFWALENTIFSGVGRFFMPVIIGGSSILLLIDSYQRIRRAVLQLGVL
jgi:PKD repeat protein